MRFSSRLLARLLAVALIAALLALTDPVGAQEQETDEITVELGMDEPVAIVHVEENDRLVVVGDDEAVILSSAGEILYRIGDLPGAVDVDASGPMAVVAAQATGELVVIDTDQGVVVNRILGGAQRISSVSFVGDTIWYAHGPDQWDAGIGRAAASEPMGTPFFLSGHVRAGSIIDVSPADPDVVFAVHAGSSPANIFRMTRNDAGGTDQLRNPYHSSFLPFVVADDGLTVWAVNNGNIIELNADDLTKTGLFYQALQVDGWRSGGAHLAAHNDEFISFAANGFVVTHRVGQPSILATADFAVRIADVDLDDTRLFTLTGGSDFGEEATPGRLTISGFDRTRPDRAVVFRMYGFGSPGDERPTISYECNDGVTSGTFDVGYGWGYQVMVSPDTEHCWITRSDAPSAQNFLHAAGSSDWVQGSNRFLFRLPGVESDVSAVLHLLDVYESPLDNARLFVELQYRDILNRQPDEGGVRFWTSQILEGRISAAGYVESLVDSPEYLGAIAPVTRLYLAYFGREPDAGGLAFWLDRYRTGTPLDTISASFASSEEFQRTYGTLDDRAFLDLVYRAVLGRSPDQGGYRFWLDRMDDGMSRGALMTAFSESPEYVEQTNPGIVVRTIYRGLLAREPDAGGFEFWTDQYRSGASLEQMIHGFLDSDEYTNRFWIGDPVPTSLRQELGQATRPVPDLGRP